MMAGMLRLSALAGILVLVGCGGHTGYEKAFSAQSALAGNSHEFDAGADQLFRAVKVTLVQQGFTIEQVDVAAGLIKAIRSLQDPKRSAYAYLITASVDVTGQPSGRSTTVTVAASQQTVLHKDSEKYFHLLGLVPIPTGRVHQTVVTKEGNIDTAAFYRGGCATNRPRGERAHTRCVPRSRAHRSGRRFSAGHTRCRIGASHRRGSTSALVVRLDRTHAKDSTGTQ
jgi:hypothetical protein